MKLRNYLKTGLLLLCGFVLALPLAGCREEEEGVAVSMFAHDHYPNQQVLGVSINDGEGSASVGGLHCCVVIPRKWKPGLTAKLSWSVYLDDDPSVPSDPKVSQKPVVKSAVVEIPQYDKPAYVHMHIYPGEKARIVISNWSFGSPFYPLPREEWKEGNEIDYFFIDSYLHWPGMFDHDPHPPTEKDWEWAKQWGLTKDGKCTDPDYLEWKKNLPAMLEESERRRFETELKKIRPENQETFRQNWERAKQGLPPLDYPNRSQRDE